MADLLSVVSAKPDADRGGELQVGPRVVGLQLVERCLGAGLEMRIPGDADAGAAPPGEVLLDPVDVDEPRASGRPR